MKATFSLLFYLKKPKNYEKGLVPIYLRITVEGKRAETTTGRECDPAFWNNESGRIKGTKEEVRAFNTYLDNLQNQVYETHRFLTEKDAIVTAESLKHKLLGKVDGSRMLMQIFKDHNKKVAALVGKEYAKGTLGRYEIALKHTKDFLAWKYQLQDIDITKIDHDFITNYDFYLRSERNCANNSAVKYIRNFKKIIRICLASGWLSKDPFINYKAKLGKLTVLF